MLLLGEFGNEIDEANRGNGPAGPRLFLDQAMVADGSELRRPNFTGGEWWKAGGEIALDSSVESSDCDDREDGGGEIIVTSPC